MELPTYFTDFLKKIRPTPNQVDDLKRGHRTLRQRLEEYEDLAPIIVSTFLQGSYRRATAIRPKGGKRSDVDIIVVTRLSQDEYPDPDEAIQLFVPFMDKYYKDKYEINGRSIGIELSYVDLDVVITSAPSESEIGILEAACVTAEETPEDVDDWRLVKSWVPLEERFTRRASILLEAAKEEAEWKLSPLYIPDREAKRWEPTHPLAQIQWTWKKNRRCNSHYVNVVKAIKWWRREKHPTSKYPKGYPVEHLIGQCCPDGITSVAEGVTRSLEAIAANYRTDALLKRTPFLPDHGVPEHNVFGRVSGEDFATFHGQVCEAAEIARHALDADSVRDSAEGWRGLFGDKFPPAPPGDSDDEGGKSRTEEGGYTPREEVSAIGGGRFA
jgi:hypothetical protein